MTREEAIKNVKMFFEGMGISLSNVTKDSFNTLIPELRESEDEKKRKELVRFLTDVKNISESGRTSWAVRKEDAEMCAGFLEYLEKQKEQNLALVPERISPKFAVGDTICRPMWSDHTIQEIYIHCNDPVYVCVNEEGTESHIPMSEQDEWERKEQKPIEDVVEDITKNKESATKFLKSAGIMDDNGELAEMYRPEEKPAEWSEEDEKNLGQVISGKYLPLGLREWFCGLPERFPSRPPFKPSEEQMKALEECGECKRCIKELREQLNKH